MSNSGYTFIDNSQLSVIEKIKLYFAKNSAADSQSTSSSTSSSFSLEDSFKNSLGEARQKSMALKFEPEDLIEDESEVVDLCSPPSSAVLQRSHQLIDLCTPPATTNGLPPKTPVSTRTKPSPDIHNTVRQNNQPKVAVGSAEKVNKSLDMDDSFLAIERECESETYLMCMDETQLTDIAEPSGFWDQTQVAMSPVRRVALNRPSTIIEESTQCSSTNNTASTRNSRSTDDGGSFSVPNGSGGGGQPIDKENTTTTNIGKRSATAKYRPSMVNVFPKRDKRQFFNSPETSAAKLSRTVSVMSSIENDSPVAAAADSDTPKSESSSGVLDDSLHLNDTIEAMDHILAQGKRLMNSGSLAPTPSSVFSPKSLNRFGGAQPMAKPRTPTEMLRANYRRRNLMEMAEWKD